MRGDGYYSVLVYYIYLCDIKFFFECLEQFCVCSVGKIYARGYLSREFKEVFI